MRGAYGKPYGLCARVKINQVRTYSLHATPLKPPHLLLPALSFGNVPPSCCAPASPPATYTDDSHAGLGSMWCK